MEYMSHAKVLWNNLPMKLIGLPLVVSAALLGGGSGGRGSTEPAGIEAAAPAKVDPVAQAYDQFLLAHRLKDEDDSDGAMAAYSARWRSIRNRRTIAGRTRGSVSAQNRAADAITTAERALDVEIDPESRDAHRVLGTVYGSLGTADRFARQPRCAARTACARR